MANDILKNIGQGLQSFIGRVPLSQIQGQEEQKKLARQQQFMQLDNARKGALFQDARVVNALLNSGQKEQALNFLGQRVNLLSQVGGDPTDTMEIVELINSGNLDQAKNLLSSVEKVGVETGFLKSNQPSELDTIQLEKARIELENLRRPGAVVDKEFLKEERAMARDTVKSFNKRASEIQSSYGKVESVLNSGKLNRMKIASAMTSMARLLSPGIVTNQDFENLSNSANPVATVLDTLRGKGEAGSSVADELQRYVDPTNPTLFDKDAFLQTAARVAGAEIPSLIQEFEGGKERALRAGISERAVNTNFLENRQYKALNEMLKKTKPIFTHPKLGDVTEEQIQQAMRNKNLTREQVLAQLQGL